MFTLLFTSTKPIPQPTSQEPHNTSPTYLSDRQPGTNSQTDALLSTSLICDQLSPPQSTCGQFPSVILPSSTSRIDCLNQSTFHSNFTLTFFTSTFFTSAPPANLTLTNKLQESYHHCLPSMAGGPGANFVRQPNNPNQGQPQQFGNMNANRGPARYDGPASRPPSQHGDQPRQNPYGPGLGYDPAKPAPAKQSVITNSRVELPSAAYNLGKEGVSLIFFLFFFAFSLLLYRWQCPRYTPIGSWISRSHFIYVPEGIFLPLQNQPPLPFPSNRYGVSPIQTLHTNIIRQAHNH